MDEIEDHGRPADVALDAYAADHEAGLAWRSGNLPAAARLIRQASQQFPERAEVWSSREQRIRQAALTGGLDTQTSVRLALAGIGAEDQGLQQVRGWNRLVGVREPEAGQ